jgi:hypothetical protein
MVAMELNLPVLHELTACKNLLIAGMGGGFDLFCGLPVYFELRRLGHQVHLASYSFTNLSRCKEGTWLSDSLLGVTADNSAFLPYCPEIHLAQWLRQERGEEVTVWCFEKTGVEPLAEGYRALVRHLSIDGLLLIDGGVDSLLHGDEPRLGTVLEDAISLVAVRDLEVPFKLIACLGLGAERDMSHWHVFQNIAELASAGAFRGTCSLVREMQSYQQYEAVVEYVHSRPVQEPSVINASVLSAVRGEYGDYHLTDKTRGSRLWISPLMPLYWFFDFDAVAERNLFLGCLEGTYAFRDAMFSMGMWLQKRKVRPETSIPLP